MKKKILIIGISIFLIIVAISSSTFALWDWQSEANETTNIVFTLTKDFSCSADGGGNITEADVVMAPSSCTNTNHAIIREVTVTPEILKNNLSINMDLWIKVDKLDSGLANSQNFKYALTTNPNSCTTDVISSGNFHNLKVGDTVNILNGTYTSTTEEKYYLYIWLDKAETSMSTVNQAFSLSIGGICEVEENKTLKLGDYVSYTPTVTSYTPDSSKTGYISQTINPSELNLWRVLNINEDGTIDLISEYVSSSTIRFQGDTGYRNIVGYLNELAAQYETDGITVGSRYFGFNGQTEYLADNYPTLMSCSTQDYLCDESKGGGDILYLKDYNQLKTVLGTTGAYTAGTTTFSSYWIASRYYSYTSSTSDGNIYQWGGRIASPDGGTLFGFKSNSTTNYTMGGPGALRPIVVLKAGIEFIDGDGSVSSPWSLTIKKDEESIINSIAPLLSDGMIPVTISNTGAVKTADVSSKWYDYENQQWANAVLVTNASRSSYYEADGKTIKANQSIPEANILAYFVWIPKYSYKMNGAEESISIAFNQTPSGYIEHPAFNFGGSIPGFWVGKFETSHSTLGPTTAMNCTDEYCANAIGLTIKPNVYSKTNDTVSSQFFASRTMETSGHPFGLVSTQVDTHMMKNSEWGAVAYLSHSIYGINGEVRLNNNSRFTTGCGAASKDGASTTACEIAYGSVSSGEYPQSTTGNITGVFDMAGGRDEHVMGVLAYYLLEPISGYTSSINSGFSGILSNSIYPYNTGVDFPLPKYYDIYTSESATTACIDIPCYGHALSETSSWYGDYAFMATASFPWITRGGNYADGAYGSGAGLFSSRSSYGNADNYSSWRTVLVPIGA